MRILSDDFTHGGIIPQKYTCDGDGINPSLRFVDVPRHAWSLVLIMDDPDVPISVREDGMWDHWIVWNIDPHINMIDVGECPRGNYGTTTSNTRSYVPPCPPDREHRYFFRLYALSSTLNLEDGATKQQVMSAMQKHIIDQSELVGVYCRM